MTAAAEEHLLAFLDALAAAGLPMPLPRRLGFLAALRRLSPADLTRLYWLARVTLLTEIADCAAFDAIFSRFFQGTSGSLPAGPKGEDGTETRRPAPEKPAGGPLRIVPGKAAGHTASHDEIFHHKSFLPTNPADSEILARLTRALPRLLPVVPSRRWRPMARGPHIDLRRSVARAVRQQGEVTRFARCGHPPRQRRLLLLIDVSGSARAQSTDFLRLAHSLRRGAKAEIFTFGTRLTRVSAALDQAAPDRALAALAKIVFDFDGGTRIGQSLAELLATSRFCALARGATVLVLSDGLERGELDTLATAVARLKRLAHRLVWLSPLKLRNEQRPETRAMRQIEPLLDHFGRASSLAAVAGELFALPAIARRRRA